MERLLSPKADFQIAGNRCISGAANGRGCVKTHYNIPILLLR